MMNTLYSSILLKYGCITLGLLLSVNLCYSQTYFPIKKNSKWGLMDASGEMVVQPRYEAMSSFEQFGYATVQENGRVGIISNRGENVMPVAFSDIKALDSLHFAVKEAAGWILLDRRQQVLMGQPCQDIQALNDDFFLLKKNGGWGLIDREGRTVVQSRYDKIKHLDTPFFIVQSEGKSGVLNLQGEVILDTEYEEVLLLRTGLFLVKKNSQWGVKSEIGQALTDIKYQSFDFLADHYLRLYAYGETHLFSLSCRRTIAQERISRFVPISDRYVMIKQRQKVGVVDFCGQPVLSEDYDEILWFDYGVFRVKRNDKWALFSAGDQALTGFNFDYISPLKGKLSMMRRGGKVGVINRDGKEVIAPVYHKIEIQPFTARAYQGQEIDLFKFDQEGNLIGDVNLGNHFEVRIGAGRINPTNSNDHSSYILDSYEWYYNSEKGRWGLRDNSTGMVKIHPSFEEVAVNEHLGISVVGLPSKQDFEWERTTIRLNKIYGLVDNNLGELIGQMQYRHIFFEDFEAGNDLARGILADGQYAFLDRSGHCQEERFTYIGPFQNGYARAYIGGRLNAGMQHEFSIDPLYDYLLDLRTSFSLVDNTKYDELLLNKGVVYGEGGKWTFLNADAEPISDQYFDYAIDMINEVGMVYKNGKWGLMGANGRLVIPCAYDDLDFLENTGNQIVKLYVRKTKYGLIDTLGKLTISAIYDEVGKVSEGRLSVMKEGLWGFTDDQGELSIACDFEAVKDFKEGLAAVKKGGLWGYVDRRGKLAIPHQYESCGDFSSGVAWVETYRGFGYIDTTGHLRIAPRFEETKTFKGQVAIVKEGGLYGLVDLSGNYVERPRYLAISDFDEFGLAIVRLNRSGDRYGVINQNGILVTHSTYREVQPFSDGLAIVKAADKYGYINASGVEVIPCKYLKAEPFTEGRAAVYESGYCGYIDRNGHQITDFEFSRCQPFADERAVVYKGMRRAGLVDISGDFVLEPSVNRLINFSEGRGLVRDQEYRFYYITEEAELYQGFYEKATEFQNGIAVIQMDKKWGIINRKGITLVRPKYSRIEDFENGYAKVELDGVSGLSDIKGEMIVQPGFEYISYAGQGLFRVEQGDQIGYFDQEGNWVWELQN